MGENDTNRGFELILERLARQDEAFARRDEERTRRYEERARQHAELMRELAMERERSDQRHIEALNEMNAQRRELYDRISDANRQALWAIRESIEQGKVLITMDGDLQNDPRDIEQFLARINDGYDIVVGWRFNRQDKLVSRRIPSKIANWLIGKVTGVPIRDNGCSLKAYRASLIKEIPLYSEMHRFIPAMASIAGPRVAEIKVKHHARQFGKSKYGISRVYKVLLDLMVIKTIASFAARPLQWFSILAAPLLLLGSITLVNSFLTLDGWRDSIAIPVAGVGIILITAALILVLGGHYTYARVPLGFWLQDLFDFARNPYDRIGHLAQGFVPAILAREALLRATPLRPGAWLFFLVVCVCLAISSVYELLEWAVAIAIGEASDSFLGTQGDPWDTQWDMFLALVGALAAQLLLARAHDRSIAEVTR